MTFTPVTATVTAMIATNSQGFPHEVRCVTLCLIDSYWSSPINKQTHFVLGACIMWNIYPGKHDDFPEFRWERQVIEWFSCSHFANHIVTATAAIDFSITSLQYCARMSLNFIIICRLIASRERICLNFKSMSNAASADRRVLKDSSIKCFASFSITCQKKKKVKKLSPVIILQEKKRARNK